MTNTPKRLHRLRVHEISIVGTPAVPGAVIGLAKAADPVRKAHDDAMAVVTPPEAREAVALAKSGGAAPASYFRAALDKIANEIARGGISAGAAIGLAAQTNDGRALMVAMASTRG